MVRVFVGLDGAVDREREGKGREGKGRFISAKKAREGRGGEGKEKKATHTQCI